VEETQDQGEYRPGKRVCQQQYGDPVVFCMGQEHQGHSKFYIVVSFPLKYIFVKYKMKSTLLSHVVQFFNRQLALCTASLLPEFQPAPCFLSAIIGHID